MTTFTPDPLVLPVVRQLYLLDFKPLEMTGSLEQAAGRLVPVAEIQDTIAYLLDSWASTPELRDVRVSQGQLWARSEMFQSDLLGLYTDMLANARATMAGDFQHGDGRPVIKTKPAEVAQVAEKILSLSREVVDDKKTLLGAVRQGPSQAPAEPERFRIDEDDDDSVYEPPERTEL